MSVSGLIGSPWKCCLRPPVPGPGLSPRRVPGFSTPPNDRIQFLRLKSFWSGSAEGCSGRRTNMGQCAMQASYGGDMTNDQPAVFPRIHVRDPYKRLGISREASEEEIIAARNYLIQKYAGHKPSVDSIEKAHNKIIYQHFSDRRKDKKINIFKKFREVRQSRPLQGARSMFRNPATLEKIIAASWYIVPLLLTFADGTEEGPTFAVGLSLVAAMLSYLRRKEWFQAFIYGAGAFIVSWLIATFLMVSVIPLLPSVKGLWVFEVITSWITRNVPCFKGLRSFEAISSLISYVLLWFFSAYLK